LPVIGTSRNGAPVRRKRNEAPEQGLGIELIRARHRPRERGIIDVRADSVMQAL